MSPDPTTAAGAVHGDLTSRTLAAVRPRTLRRNAAASVARWFVTIAIIAVVFPLMLARLGADGFGLWAVLTTPTSMAALAGLGVAPATVVLLGRALATALAAAEREEAERHLHEAGRLCGATLLLSVATAAVTVAVGWLVTGPALQALHVGGSGDDERFLFRAAVVCLAAMLLGSGLAAQLEAARRVDLSSLSWGAVSVLNAGFLLVAVLAAPGLRALAFVQIGTACANVAVPLALLARSHIIVLWRWMDIDGATLLALTRLALGLGGASALTAVGDPLVKFTIGATAGTPPVAAYELAQRVVHLSAGVFTSALQPLVAHVSGAVGEHRLRDVPGTVARALRTTVGVGFPILTTLALGAPAIIAVWLRGDAPDGAALSITLLCPGMAASLLATPAYHALQGAGHGRRVLSVQVVTVAGMAVVLGLLSAGTIDASYAGGLAVAIGMAMGAGVTLMHYRQVYGGDSLRLALRGSLMGLAIAACVAPWPLVARWADMSDLGQLAIVVSAAVAAVSFAVLRERPWKAPQA